MRLEKYIQAPKICKEKYKVNRTYKQSKNNQYSKKARLNQNLR